MYPFTSHYVTLPIDNIDTDQIIPARFLKTIYKDGLGGAAFADWRYDNDGLPNQEFVLNRSESHGAQILVVGENFGCGSSREHAPWALLGAGIRAIVSRSFADIFRTNALKNGLLPIQVDADTMAQLLTTSGEMTVDLDQQTITTSTGVTTTFSVEPFAKHCLLHDIDQLGFLLAASSKIDEFERKYDSYGTIA